MTVAQLIQILKTFPPDAHVIVNTIEGLDCPDPECERAGEHPIYNAAELVTSHEPIDPADYVVTL